MRVFVLRYDNRAPRRHLVNRSDVRSKLPSGKAQLSTDVVFADQLVVLCEAFHDEAVRCARVELHRKGSVPCRMIGPRRSNLATRDFTTQGGRNRLQRSNHSRTAAPVNSASTRAAAFAWSSSTMARDAKAQSPPREIWLTANEGSPPEGSRSGDTVTTPPSRRTSLAKIL